MKFVIKKNESGQFTWRAVSDGNNETLAVSETLNRKQSAMNAIDIIRREAATARIDDQTDENDS